MEKTSKTRLGRIYLFLFICFFQVNIALAVFDLSYTLTEGGAQLDFTPTLVSRGIRVRIDSDISTRYQVVQRIIAPLQERNNPQLNLSDHFLFRGVSGTNRFGDLRAPETEAVVRSDEIMYVSDSVGHADTFTLVYALKDLLRISPGDYSGRISFTLYPLGGGQSPITKIVEVRVLARDLPTQGNSLEISFPSASSRLSFNPTQGKNTADVLFKIINPIQGLFSVKQFLRVPFESNSGSRLDERALQFMVQGIEKSESILGLTPLRTQTQILYTSAPSRNRDSFLVRYSLQDTASLPAGLYRSTIEYFLSQGGVERKIGNAEIEIEIPQVFDLEVQLKTKENALEFRDVKPNDPPQRREVILEIKSNRKVRYQVIQDVSSLLVNKEGKSIPPENFTFQMESLDSKGMLKFPGKTKVLQGSSTVFVSNLEGSPDRFKIIYQLIPGEHVSAGDYTANVTYSLLEL